MTKLDSILKSRNINLLTKVHIVNSMVFPVAMYGCESWTIKKPECCWRGCGEKGTLLHCWWECKLVQPLWRTVWRFFKKVEIELPFDPAIPLLGIYTEETRIERYMYPNVHRSTVYNSQDMEATQMSIGRQMDKKAVVHIHNGILLSHQKECI